MSKKEKTAAGAAEQKTEKVLTKYDQKQLKRKEAEEKAKKEAVKGKVIGVAIVAFLVLFILSFPIRTAIALNTPYIVIGGEDVSRVEFDYYYNNYKNTYVSEVGQYYSMFGMDVDNIEYEQYTEDFKFKDMFEQTAVQNITQTKALVNAAKAEGFVYDTSEELNAWKQTLEADAKEYGYSLKDFVRINYGSLATIDRLEPVMENIMLASAFHEKKSNDIEITEEDILAYYEENKQDYDLIDYHLSVVEAELPKTAPDGSVSTDADGNEIAYEPTEEEIAAAMAEAKTKAEELEKTISTDGDEYVSATAESINDLLKEFIYDESRKAGDTIVVEDTNRNRYLVASFDGRRLVNDNTVDVRMITIPTIDITTAEGILDEWKAGEATEESFIELVAKYDEAGAAEVDGLYEGVTGDEMGSSMAEWIMSEERVAGDTFTYTNEEDEVSYVIYYVGSNEPTWKLEIETLLRTEEINAYVTELMADYKVEDPKGRLDYIEITASLEAEYAASQEVTE